MIRFDSAYPGGRPVRLKESTRAFADESLRGKYGDTAMEMPYIEIGSDEIQGLDAYSAYDFALKKIVCEAPIRICENELICGSATLGGAIEGRMPAKVNGEPLTWGVNHLTLNFSRMLTEGVDSYEAEIKSRLKDTSLNSRQKKLLHSMLNAIECLHIWHGRYIDKADGALRENLEKVPFKPAASFREALQSLWFMFAFTRLTGNWSGIGRIDKFLGDFLKEDLKENKITLDFARELLASFFIKGCEWIRSDTPAGSGDAQHYQNIVLGGIDESGSDITNEVTYLVLDIVEELPIGDFPITVRINGKTPEKLLNRIAEVIRHGGGTIAVYNEELILKSLTDYGYDYKEAVNFANDGCWEVQIPGKTMFTYVPFDALQILLKDTLNLDGEPAHFDNFDSLYSAFYTNLKSAIKRICENVLNERVKDRKTGTFYDSIATPIVDMLEDGCIDKARGYFEGGPIYTVISPHIGGAPDAGNSLNAIDALCFKEKKISFDELMKVLKNNWNGEEVLRQYARNHIVYYGNDNDMSDRYVTRIIDDFADMCSEYGRKYPIWFPAGVSTFGRQIEWIPGRTAVPFGFKKGDILSGNDSPTPGTDINGATAIICSYCKADLAKQTTGAALDIKLFPKTVVGENGINALKALIRGFCALGGYFMQIDVEDAQTLKNAQEHPEKYKTLSVRVSGWNARFVTLDSQWQRMIIERTEQNL